MALGKKWAIPDENRHSASSVYIHFSNLHIPKLAYTHFFLQNLHIPKIYTLRKSPKLAYTHLENLSNLHIPKLAYTHFFLQNLHIPNPWVYAYMHIPIYTVCQSGEASLLILCLFVLPQSLQNYKKLVSPTATTFQEVTVLGDNNRWFDGVVSLNVSWIFFRAWKCMYYNFHLLIIKFTT